MSFGTAIAGIGTVLQVSQQIKQGKQQQQIFEYNSAVNRQKAQLAKIAGEATIAKLRRQKKSFSAKQEAAFAKAGVRLTGSPLQVLADSAAELEFDIMTEDFNTRVAILNANSAAELDLIRGDQANKAGFINAGATLLTQIPNFISSGNRGSSIPTTTHRPTGVSGPLRSDGSF
jgi:hypothetical protein